MDTLTAIHNRRSVRSWTGEPVSDEHLDILLRAAMTAPSSDNAQPWHYIVIRSKDSLQAMSDVNKWIGMAPKADLGIIVCGELALEETPGLYQHDCSAAIQNMLLAAVDLGLGAVWTGVNYDPELVVSYSKLFGIPEGVIPHSLVLIGHPAKEQKPRDRFKLERIHREKW